MSKLPHAHRVRVKNVQCDAASRVRWEEDEFESKLSLSELARNGTGASPRATLSPRDLVQSATGASSTAVHECEVSHMMPDQLPDIPAADSPMLRSFSDNTMQGVPRVDNGSSLRSPGKRSRCSSRMSTGSSDSIVYNSTDYHTRDKNFVDKYAADKYTVLQAFRLIGGSHGVSKEDLRQAVAGISTPHIKKELQQNLTGLFETIDKDRSGALDIVEFGRLVQKSTYLQKAVYELIEKAEEMEAKLLGPQSHVSLDSALLRWLDCFACISSLLSVGLLAVQTDLSPQWKGWYLIEFCFMVVFSIEIGIRSAVMCRHSSFFTSPMNTCDVAINLIGWVDVSIFLSANGFTLDGKTTRWQDGGFATVDGLAPLRCLRILRLVRGFRLRRRMFWYCYDLQVFIACILNSMRFAIWALAVLFLLVLVWALALRLAIEYNWGKDRSSDVLSHIFRSTPSSMLVVFRCMVLRSDGAGVFLHMEESGAVTGSLFAILADRFGWVFNIAWTASELFISLGICNVITALFVLQAGENSSRVRESINSAHTEEYRMLLTKLDKLLRTLIHPGREQCNPKDRNAAEVANLIRTKNPEAAAQIPNMEAQIVRLAKSIQEAKKLHQSAMDSYEAEDTKACRELFAIPSAQTYFVNGEEKLLADDTADANNPLKLRVAPMGAVVVNMDQSTDCLETLLDDASQVQKVVKKAICPNSEWAENDAAGSSGHIWKQSKGLCDEAIDPGRKSLERIEKKVMVKYGGRTQRNRDYARLSLVYEKVRNLVQAIPRLLQFNLDTDGMKVMTLENRFANPQPLGWRDVTMLLRVVVPDSCDDALGPRFHMMELQLRLKGLMEVNHESHAFYKEIRSSLPDDVLSTVLDRLVTDTTLELGITKSEWLQCLRNKQVVKLLDDLHVPLGNCRRFLFDVIDVDGSGTVTSSELRETLSLYTQPSCAPELQGCHARVRDIQRHLQTKVDPHLELMEEVSDVMHELYNQFNQFAWEIQGARHTGLRRKSTTGFDSGKPSCANSPASYFATSNRPTFRVSKLRARTGLDRNALLPSNLPLAPVVIATRSQPLGTWRTFLMGAKSRQTLTNAGISSAPLPEAENAHHESHTVPLVHA